MSTTSAATIPTIYPCLAYRDAHAAIEWLEKAFGFTRRVVYPGPDGTVVHSEMSFGNGGIMLYTAKPEKGWVSARDLPALHQTLYVVVDDPDAHYAGAKAAGAEIVMELTNQDYGSREYSARDLEGNHWTFGTYRPEL